MAMAAVRDVRDKNDDGLCNKITKKIQSFFLYNYGCKTL
jgi:hypothetical protein